MKTFIAPLTLLIVSLACTPTTNKKAFNLSSLPPEWIRLTKTDTGYIIYNSCDAGNLLFSITYKPTPGLLLHGQQEDDSLDILDCYQLTNDTIVIHARNRGYHKTQDIKFIWADKEKQLGHFISDFPDGGKLDEIAVTQKKQKAFPVYNQPCRDCWGDECDSAWHISSESADKVDSSEVRKTDTTALSKGDK